MSSVLTEQASRITDDGAVGPFEEVLSALGHDLRSPLGAAHLNIEAALRRLPASSSMAVEIRASLQRASEIVKHTVSFMEDLLNEAREMDARTTAPSFPPRSGRFEPLDLRDVIHHCVALHSTTLQSARCALTIHCDANLIGAWSRAAIYQILSNLIVNATKYAPGQPIEVHAARDGKAVVIIVSDRGPGFSVEEQGRVFERFHREPRAGSPEGRGLGLWIVQRAAERMGATVRLISAPGEGALFLVDIPCEPT